MAQTTDGISKSNFKVEVSAAGSVWTDISGFATSVTPSDGDRIVGEQQTADGDSPIIKGGKRNSVKLEINIVYTKGSSDAFKVVWDLFESGAGVYVRYAPGTITASLLFTTANSAGTAAAAVITNCLPPEMDSSTGDVATASFTVVCSQLLEGTVS